MSNRQCDAPAHGSSAADANLVGDNVVAVVADQYSSTVRITGQVRQRLALSNLMSYRVYYPC